MAVDDIAVLNRELPELFARIELPAEWTEDFVFIPIDHPDALREDTPAGLPTDNEMEFEASLDLPLPVPVSLSMGEAGQIERLVEDAFSRQASPELHNGFQQWVTDAIGANAHNRRGGRIEHFVDVFGLRWLRPYFNDRRFDLARYVADVLADKVERVSEGVVPLFGSLYLARNREKIRERIKYRVGRWKTGASATTVWVPPDDRLWGRGSALSEAWADFDLIQIEKRQIVLCVRCRAEDEESVTRRFDRLTRGDRRELRVCPPLYSVSVAGDPMLELLLFSDEFVVRNVPRRGRRTTGCVPPRWFCLKPGEAPDSGESGCSGTGFLPAGSVIK